VSVCVCNQTLQETCPAYRMCPACRVSKCVCVCVCSCHHTIRNTHLCFFCHTTKCVDPFCHRSVWFVNDEEHGQLVISLPTGTRYHTALMYRTRRKHTKISSLRIGVPVPRGTLVSEECRSLSFSFLLSSHRHSYIDLLLISRFIDS